MGFSSLKEYFASGTLPPSLASFASIVEEAQPIQVPREVTMPRDVRNIYHRGVRKFQLPDYRPVAIQDTESCVVLWDTAPAQAGLKADRNFLAEVRLPELFGTNTEGCGDLLARQFRQYQQSPSDNSVSLLWGTVAAVRYRKCRRCNFEGVCPVRGWHFRNHKTEVSITLEGAKSYLFLGIQPSVLAIVLTAIENLAYQTPREA